MRAYLKQPLAIATLVACLCGLLTLAQPLDQIYWNMRFLFGQNEAPQAIVLVKVDGTERAGSASREADEVRLLRVLREQLPERIYLDRKFSPQAAAGIARELRALDSRVAIVARFSRSDTLAAGAIELPNPAVVGNTNIVVSGWLTNFWLYGTNAPYAVRIGNRTYPTLSAHIANKPGTTDETYRPDFSVDPLSVRSISASQLLTGRVSPGLLTGRVVIVTDARSANSAPIGYFGHGRINPVYLDIAGVEGLRSGLSINIEWFALVVLFAGATLLALRQERRWVRWSAYVLVVTVTLLGPVGLEKLGIYSNPSASIVAACVYGALRLWSKWRKRMMQTGSSGLPNFVALANRTLPPTHEVVVATISRYEEMLATLPQALHGECARQIARRFSVGCHTNEIYHGDGGHFAWIEPARSPELQAEHFEGMRALFSAPLMVGGHMFDTNVHFGLDRNYEFDALTRINTALASAGEAVKHGRTIEQFEANRLANAPWELSLLARIDEGMRNGDIWLAYQPQWDYHETRMSGAEALIRWNDPVRGPIRPDEFILQAERAGRIDALTYWVLDHAITSAQALNAYNPPFQMSINLSAQMVDKPSLVSSIVEIVRGRGIDWTLLTIEVTETASVHNRPAAIRNLQQLQALGMRISIDDFGTGEASLCYLADLPSDELKLDRRFVSRIVHHERDRKIVTSTIGLAHALNQVVVAEGIEDQATFDLLRQMGCDVAQGYYIGRPETFDQLRARYAAPKRKLGSPFTTC
ncbi:MAG: EAL domain-containing protein [Pseudomonadota bacterium]